MVQRAGNESSPPYRRMDATQTTQVDTHTCTRPHVAYSRPHTRTRPHPTLILSAQSDLSPPPSSNMDSTSSSASGSSSTSSSTSTNSSSDGDAAIYGSGAYYNIRRGIELRQIDDDFSGLFTTEFFPKGTILWKNRGDGPAEEKYRKIYGEDIQHLTPSELKYFIRYSYQNDDEFFISPLSEEEVHYDYSNFWNHSCRPNTLPCGEDLWVAIRDIEIGEQLTIDYACFDSNEFICIDRCLCGQPECREFVRGDDYRITELQHKYAGHFLPYIQRKIDEEQAIMKAGGVIGGAGGPENKFDAASVRKYHQTTVVDIAAHNARGVAELVARFSCASENDTSSGDAADQILASAQTTSGSSGSSDSEDASPPDSPSPREREEEEQTIVVRKGATRQRRQVIPNQRKILTATNVNAGSKLLIPAPTAIHVV